MCKDFLSRDDRVKSHSHATDTEADQLALRSACMCRHKQTLSNVIAGPGSAAVDQVGEFDASGFLFKDQIEITALDDPFGT